MNRFFSSVFTKENFDNIPCIDKIKKDITNLDTVIIDEQKVRDKLNNLKPFSAPGPDGISPFILKELSSVLSTPLSILFQKSICEGHVPSDWKIANVSPIFKKGSKFCPGNYRPISLTSIICKVLESIIKDQIMEHLKHYNLIFSSQHGFMPKKFGK